MAVLEKKIPRGVINHSVINSLNYLRRSLYVSLVDNAILEDFEKSFAKYCERNYCIAFPFARTAIYYVLKSLNLPKGAEVLMPPITIKGIVDVVISLGLVPRYVDSDPETMCFSIDELGKSINSQTKVAIITPLFGLVPNMEEIVLLLQKNNIYIIEDFSQCLNGTYDGKRVGTFGDVGIYSSSSIKTLDTLGGGLAITDDEFLRAYLLECQKSLHSPSRTFLIKKAWINLLRNFATTQPWFSVITFPILSLMRLINPQAALKQTGNRNKSRISKLPELWFRRFTSEQARIGIHHLIMAQDLDSKRISNVDAIKEICGLNWFPKTLPKSKNVYWQFICLVNDSLFAQSFFSKKGVDVATSSLELVCELSEYPNQAHLPQASRIHKNGIFIPCHPDLSREDIERVSRVTQDFFNS